MNLENLGIGKRLGIAFGVVLALVVAMASLGAIELRQTAEAVNAGDDWETF